MHHRRKSNVLSSENKAQRSISVINHHRKISSAKIPPPSRKLSLQSQYEPTNNPFILAKKTSVIEQHEREEIPEYKPLRRVSQFWPPTFNEPVKPRQRSHTVTALNSPPGFSRQDLDEMEDEDDEEDEDLEFVDVRDEILLIKDQFDKLVSILDKDIFPVNEDPDEKAAHK